MFRAQKVSSSSYHVSGAAVVSFLLLLSLFILCCHGDNNIVNSTSLATTVGSSLMSQHGSGCMHVKEVHVHSLCIAYRAQSCLCILTIHVR